MLTYIVGPPIRRTEDFYGRSHQVARFYEIVAGTQTQSISILGVRRAGKTSFLQYIAQQDVISRYVPNPRDYVMIYIDMSSCRNPSDFYQRLMVNLERKLSGTKPFNLWQKKDGHVSLYDVETVLCQHSHRRIILLLDEFDQIKGGNFDETFLTELRAMTSVLDYELACVTASFWDLYQLGTQIGLPPTSPFYNIFYPTPIYLPGFAYSEAELLIKQPAAEAGIFFSDQAIAGMYNISGSMPFFLQATAARWFEERLFNQPPTYDMIREIMIMDLAPYFEQWWRYLNKCERWLLLQVARNDLQETSPCNAISLVEARRRLLAYGLLVSEKKELMVNGVAFAQWLQKHAKIQEKTKPMSTPIDISVLRRTLMDMFNIEELRTLCFDLRLNYEDLGGENRAGKIRELILMMQARPNGLSRLVEAIERERGAVI